MLVEKHVYLKNPKGICMSGANNFIFEDNRDCKLVLC